jgi:hypothetical protein
MTATPVGDAGTTPMPAVDTETAPTPAGDSGTTLMPTYDTETTPRSADGGGQETESAPSDDHQLQFSVTNNSLAFNKPDTKNEPKVTVPSAESSTGGTTLPSTGAPQGKGAPAALGVVTRSQTNPNKAAVTKVVDKEPVPPKTGRRGRKGGKKKGTKPKYLSGDHTDYEAGGHTDYEAGRKDALKLKHKPVIIDLTGDVSERLIAQPLTSLTMFPGIRRSRTVCFVTGPCLYTIFPLLRRDADTSSIAIR